MKPELEICHVPEAVGLPLDICGIDSSRASVKGPVPSAFFLSSCRYKKRD